MGILRLGQRYSDTRLDAACARALASGIFTYKGICNILESGLDQTPLVEPASTQLVEHANLRGPAYYN